MQRVAVIFILFCCSRVPSTLANNASHHGEDEDIIPNIPTSLPSSLPSIPDAKNLLNNSVHNVTSLFYDNCNITSCNPVHYKHCYDDKAAQLIVHAIAILLGIVFAFFGKGNIVIWSMLCYR